jgi:NitT/TauT family transport system substrate-binding protein
MEGLKTMERLSVENVSFSFGFKEILKDINFTLEKGKEELINRFINEYQKSLSWYKQNSKEAANLVVKTLPMLEEQGLADSIEHVTFESVNANETIEDLEFFFSILQNSDAKLIGGKLPNKELYYKSN